MNIGIIGALGRMGKELQDCFESGGHLVSYRKDREEEILKDTPQCLVDFSSADALSNSLDLARNFSCPLLIGTTALEDVHWQKIHEASKHIPIFYSANYSLGIHLFHRMLRAINKQLSTWSVSMVEIHHKQKLDMPSGTALALKQSLDVPVDIHALRMEGIPGEHTVILTQHGETLRIEHRALSRAVFAQGAVSCALWLVRQSPGLYSMEDMMDSTKEKNNGH
jgi:4-hydroxy-tetrahydrodipicolinate reductase